MASAASTSEPSKIRGLDNPASISTTVTSNHPAWLAHQLIGFTGDPFDGLYRAYDGASEPPVFGLEPRASLQVEAWSPGEDSKSRHLRNLRNREMLLRLKRYRHPPLWSKRWWFYLPGRIVTVPPRMFYNACCEAIASIASWAWRRFLYKRLWRKCSRAPEAEGAALRYIRAHTSIPVPRLWFTFTWRNTGTWLIMDRIPGETLDSVWYNSTPEDKADYAEQLASIVKQLRSLQTPYGDKICSAAGGSLVDYRIYGCQRCGPFADEDELNKAMLLRVPKPYPSQEDLCHDIRHPIVFTHGDLALRNIMVKDGKIVAILDWEGAGWFPAHWEYVKAHFTNREPSDQVGGFRPYLDKVVPPYPKELKADQAWILPHWNFL